MDTGNHLYEPLSKKPVCLVEYESLKPCFKNRDGKAAGFRIIPYHSIGKKHGVLPGITADKLVFISQGKRYEQSGGVIGIYPGKLSGSGNFHAIVHPDILKK